MKKIFVLLTLMSIFMVGCSNTTNTESVIKSTTESTTESTVELTTDSTVESTTESDTTSTEEVTTSAVIEDVSVDGNCIEPTGGNGGTIENNFVDNTCDTDTTFCHYAIDDDILDGIYLEKIDDGIYITFENNSEYNRRVNVHVYNDEKGSVDYVNYLINANTTVTEKYEPSIDLSTFKLFITVSGQVIDMDNAQDDIIYTYESEGTTEDTVHVIDIDGIYVNSDEVIGLR